jgi:hypothetical protein
VIPTTTTLRLRLLADPDVAALVGARVFPIQRGQTAPLNVTPAITYLKVDDVPEPAMGYGPAFGPVRVQYTCWSKYDAEAANLAWRVRRALRGFSDPASGIERVVFDSEGADDYDPATGLYTSPVDFLAWVNEQVA